MTTTAPTMGSQDQFDPWRTDGKNHCLSTHTPRESHPQRIHRRQPKKRHPAMFRSTGHMLSRAQLAPSQVPAKSQTSPSKPALKPSYSHIVKHGLKTPTHDPGNTHMMKSCAPPVLQVSHVTTCDPGKQESHVTTHDPGKPGDLPRDWSSTWPCDVTRFRCTTCPLIGTWKTMGQSTVDRRINKVTRLTIVTHVQSTVNAAQH